MHARAEEAVLARAARSTALPGDPGLWVFILADMGVFALLFLLFTLGRAGDVALYERSRHALSAQLGLANTLILLTSSWTMVQAVHSARLGERARTMRFLAVTMVVGAGFAISKGFEYAGKAKAGLSMLTNDFFMYYFALTGLHFLHFAIGMAAIAVTLAKVRSEPSDGRLRVWIESVGCYWHMVDLLWIVLFPLLYLQRAA
jgi:nitric oxide reductase NorE protein